MCMGGFLDGSWIDDPGGRFSNRYHAGRAIVEKFGDVFRNLEGKGVVVGLPRGGVEIAAAVATELNLPIDFRSVKKVGHPFQPEFAIGAVDISGTSVRNPSVNPDEDPPDKKYKQYVQKALEEARKIETDLRGSGTSYIRTADWCLVVDDGAATGLTLLAAVKGLKSEGKKVYVAVPVASTQAKDLIEEVADGFYTVQLPKLFMAVGQFYDDFSPVPIEAVRKYLH